MGRYKKRQVFVVYGVKKTNGLKNPYLYKFLFKLLLILAKIQKNPL